MSGTNSIPLQDKEHRNKMRDASSELANAIERYLRERPHDK